MPYHLWLAPRTGTSTRTLQPATLGGKTFYSPPPTLPPWHEFCSSFIPSSFLPVFFFMCCSMFSSNDLLQCVPFIFLPLQGLRFDSILSPSLLSTLPLCMLILFAFSFSGKGFSLSLVAHGRHFTPLYNYLSALLICLEWSWLCSKRACGFPHFWLFAVVLAHSESPSVWEEPEQFSHSVFSPPLPFSLAFSRFSIVAHAVF